MIRRDPIPGACRAARESLDGPTSDQTAAHLSACPDCRTAAEEMESLLSRLKQAPAAAAPDTLSTRLAAIAGPEASEPLWLAPSGDGSLPSPRQERRKGLATGSIAVVACMGLLFTLGLLLAPPLAEVSDASATANREFDLSLGIGAGAQAVNVVMASAQGGRLSPTTRIERPGVMTGIEWHQVSQDTALRMLLDSVDPGVGYRGVQRVTLAGDAGYVTANVSVAQQPGSALSVAVHDESGVLINSGVLPPRQSDVVSSMPPSAEHFRVARGGSIAGQTTLLLEAKRSDRSLVARWWLAPELGLVLWNETFDASGALVRSAGFTDLHLTSTPPKDISSVPLQLSKAPAFVRSATAPMCSNGFNCSSELAGFKLVSISSDSPHQPSVVHSTYEKDGVCVTVLQQRGRLATPNPAGRKNEVYGVSDDRSVITWQSGSVVYTVTTNAGPSVAMEVADELPHRPPASTHPVRRALDGLGRLVGLGPR